ncbi:MAG TPA: PIG-L deacetylase family protein [Armatimonadota bacterium]|jgi:LmbE family N-acetylglucosaminyl deacetylase
MERILAFGCHPDDIEFMAAGTLALLAQRGYEIHFATMTGGEVGHPTLSVQQIRATRLQEAANAAQVIGGHYHYAGGADLEVEYNSEYRKKAVRVLREVDPFIVFTNPPMDYLADHEQTSLLVRNAAYIASVPNYDCGMPTTPTSRFPYVYYWNATGSCDIFGRPLPLSCAVDITTVIDSKVEMLACHKSQREWLAYHNGWDEYIENMKWHSREDGKRSGREYAEGFAQHRSTGHPKDNILKQILGDLCLEFS